MSTDSSNSNLVDRLMSEYLDRKQIGEGPTIEEYCKKYPDHADEIRSLFRFVDMADADLTAGEASKSLVDAGAESPLTQLAGYRIIREIGRGGMGVVYEAEHEGLGRRAALKVLPRHASQDSQSVQRFVREGKAIAKMHHSNIVPLYEVGEDAGRFFLAMQLIEGRSLDQVIREVAEIRAATKDSSGDHHSGIEELLSQVSDNKPSRTGTTSFSSTSGSVSMLGRYYRQIAGIGAQASEALAYAHTRGFVHRDVKPSNLLLDASGVTWLTDFGLAKSENDDLTHTGDFVGTLRYMAPERFKGQCDERSDIYGLGLTLYEFLALRPAFDSSDRLSAINKISTEDPPRLRSIDRSIPRDLETIVMKAIDKDPKSRYASAKALAEDLDNFVQDLPIMARRHSVPEQLWRWSRRHRGVAAAVAFATISLVLLAVVSTYSAITQSALRQRAETAQQESESRGQALKQRGEQLQARTEQLQTRTQELQQQSDTLQRNLYYAQMNLASEASAKSFGAETVKARLQATHPDTIGKDLRGWEWFYLKGLVSQEHYASAPQPGWTWQVDFSPDGSKLANAVNGWGFQVRDANTGAIIKSKKTGSCSTLQWSPDGKRLATGDYGGDVYIWDAETLEEKQCMLRDDDAEIGTVRWSPDGKKIASFVTLESYFSIWDAESGELIRNMEMPSEQGCRILEWSPNGEQLVVITHGTAFVLNPESGEQLAELEGVHGRRVCFSPDGTRIATSQPVQVWDWRQQELLVEGPEDTSPSIVWRPGHEQLIVFKSGGLAIWDIESGNTVRTFYGQTGILSIACSSDGLKIATSGGDRTVRIWNIEGFQPLREFLSYGHNDSLDWEPNGQDLIGNSSTNVVHILNTDTSKVTQRPFAKDDELEGNRIWAIVANAIDGRLAVGGQTAHVRVWNRASDEIDIYEGRVGETHQLAWSSDGRLAAICWPPYVAPDSEKSERKTANNLVVWDRDGRLVAEPRPTHGSFGKGLAWHPNATEIATAAPDGFIRIWDPSTLDLVREIPMPEEHRFFERSEIRWSPDGSRLASANEYAVLIWDVKTGTLVGKLDEIREPFRAVDWSPDGRLLAAGTYNSTSVWDAETFRLAIKFPMGVTRVRWAPDGRRLGACMGNKFMILDATRGYELEEMSASR